MKDGKKTIISYDFLQNSFVTFDLDKYSKDIILLEGHHYTNDLVFLDKIRTNARKLGYNFEKELFIKKKKYQSPIVHYKKFNLFTKIDTNLTTEFPIDKIVIFRSETYCVESYAGEGWYGWHHFVVDDYEKYPEYMRLFCGKKGFEWNNTSDMNPINTIVIVIVEDLYFALKILSKYHQNYVLFCVIPIADPHKVIIGPDINRIQDFMYEKKIEELKFLLGLTDDAEAVNKDMYKGDRYKHLFEK